MPTLHRQSSDVQVALSKAIKEAFGEQAYLQAIFPDVVVVGQFDYELGTSKMYEATYEIKSNGTYTFGEKSEVELAYVQKRMAAVKSLAEIQHPTDAGTIGGVFVVKAAAKQIAWAPVLVPGEDDSDGEQVSAEKIEQVAHDFMESYGNIDEMHTLNNVDAKPVESYITPDDLTVKSFGEDLTIPKGSWVMAVKVRDADVWKKIEDGDYTGFSVMGVRKAAYKSAAEAVESGQKSVIEAGFKRTLLQDLGPEWVAPFVSIVDVPAVPKAKWFALKSAGPSEESENTGFSLLQRLGFGAEKKGRKFSDKTLKEMKAAHENLIALIEEAEAERSEKSKEIDMDKEELEAILKSALEPVHAEIAALKAERGNAGPNKEGTGGGDKAESAAGAAQEGAREQQPANPGNQPSSGSGERADEAAERGADENTGGAASGSKKSVAELEAEIVALKAAATPKSAALKAAEESGESAPEKRVVTTATGAKFERDHLGRARQIV